MARVKGSANLSASLEVLAGAPLDARLVVNEVSDLTASGSYPYSYIGMVVSVKAEEKQYMLIGADPTDENNWKALGTGGGGGTDSYSDLSNKPQINGVTLSGNKSSEDLGLQGETQFSTMPVASEDNVGKIIQYIGDATGDLIPGYFYQCVSDGEDPATYSWIAKNVQAGGGSGGTSDYDELTNKPTVNGVTLSGNKTTADLGIAIPSVIDDLTDVNFDNLADGQLLAYDSTNQEWTNVNPGAGSVSELGDVGDVTLTDIQDGQVLKWDNINSIWVNANESGGGSSELTHAINAAITVGGISAGTEYPVGTDLEDILSDLLEPTLLPTFTAPSATITYGASQYYAVGATVTAMVATVALNRGAITPAYGTDGYRSGEATGYSIATTGADTEFSDSSENSGSFNVPALTRATKGTIVVTGTASYAAGEQPKDSKGGDYDEPLVAGSVTASKTLTFIQPYYYGISNTSTIADFTGLTENVTAKGNKTFNFTTNNQYMVFAYDSSYGNLKNIVDGNGFDVTGGWTKSSLTVDGFSYFVYVANSPTTDTNAPFTFKY